MRIAKENGCKEGLLLPFGIKSTLLCMATGPSYLAPAASSILSLRRNPVSQPPPVPEATRPPPFCCSFCLRESPSLFAWPSPSHPHDSGALPIGPGASPVRVTLFPCFSLIIVRARVYKDPSHPLLDHELHEPVASSCVRCSLPKDLESIQEQRAATLQGQMVFVCPQFKPPAETNLRTSIIKFP